MYYQNADEQDNIWYGNWGFVAHNISVNFLLHEVCFLQLLVILKYSRLNKFLAHDCHSFHSLALYRQVHVLLVHIIISCIWQFTGKSFKTKQAYYLLNHMTMNTNCLKEMKMTFFEFSLSKYTIMKY